ncbi:diacylglycerol kinase, putative [Acanthamoeba castellanii str. Neff]|uniref:Diacylglycerol kinase n=1 Tax=Acanthamoeba castellanii (strain ATCC 30010 / Neff) TaxID=1257118 RepID=L8H6A6_ACACF|nr:diacylglycerol kinase, putative [Acanthamoeba castellanii str. Neff]ELR20665.1 diacylglycerol kinase, putative [Acanthamoeba castellanii str. Neff]
MEALRTFLLAEERPDRDPTLAMKVGGHVLVPTRFNKPSHCDHCGLMIWGLIGKQGLSCTECRYKCHYECEEKTTKLCKETTAHPPVPGLAAPGVHEFASIDLYAKGLLLGDILYCNVCRRSILNALGGLQCVDKADVNCVIPFLPQTADKADENDDLPETVPLPSEFLQDQQKSIPAPSAKPADDDEEEEEQEARDGNGEKEKEKEKEIEKKKSRSARRRDSKRKTKAKHERLGRPIDTGVEEWERSPKAGPTVLATWPHHWVEGNLPSSALCMFCAESITSGSKMSGYRCYWCGGMVHSECRRLSTVCTFGKRADIILPPFCISPYQDSARPHIAWKIHPEKLPAVCQRPLLVFINPRSGGQQGELIIRGLKSLINPLQIFDLRNGGPKPGLETFGALVEAGRDFAILGCGGDGTIGWICSELDKTGWPVERMPSELLEEIERAHTVLLDRWRITITRTHHRDADEKEIDSLDLAEELPGESLQKVYIANNYFSVGIDAKVALEFHLARESRPERFTSRGVNKLKYFELGAAALFDGCAGLSKNLTLEVDGCEIAIPRSVEGVIVTNLPSWAGGTNLWDPPEEGSKPISHSDRMIEVVGLKGAAHLGMIKAKQTLLSGGPIQLAQGREVSLTLKEQAVPVQVDGEPWLQQPCTIRIVHHSQVPMLRRRGEPDYPSAPTGSTFLL